MERTKIVRGLRIAWTALCGVVCVLLVVLWVRSYWQLDWLRIKQPAWSVASLDGRLRFNDVYNLNNDRQRQARILIIRRFDGQNVSLWYAGNADLVPVGVGKSVPFWALVVTTAALAAIPCTPARFSLRTLLIATTLIGVLLGLVGWMIR